MEFLKANGIEDHSFVKEMDYQEVLNSQEIFGDELQMFAKKEMQKEVKICIKMFKLFEMLAEVVFVWKEIIFKKNLWDSQYNVVLVEQKKTQFS